MTEFVTSVTSSFDEETQTETHLWDNGEVTVEKFNEEGETIFFQSYTGKAVECFIVESGQIRAVVEMEDTQVHTDRRPFCSDESCWCHKDDALFDEYIMNPMLAGLLTSYEANRIMWNEQI